jgi:hypothetical protein
MDDEIFGTLWTLRRMSPEVLDSLAGSSTMTAERVTMDAADRHVRAWLALAGALGVHVADEALTGFLDFYNPLVLQIRSSVPWFPMPTFTFGVWLIGLIALVVTLVLLAPIVRNGGIPIRVASWVLVVIMFLNGVGHLAGSVYFGRWLPGATSAPLLLVTSIGLARAVAGRSFH